MSILVCLGPDTPAYFGVLHQRMMVGDFNFSHPQAIAMVRELWFRLYLDAVENEGLRSALFTLVDYSRKSD